MNSNLMRITIYVLSWCAWACRNLILFPAGMMTLIVVLLIVRDHSSPSHILVNIIQTADEVTDGVNWTWRECPSISSNSNEFPSKLPFQPSVLLANCPEVISDANGYAAHFNRSFLPLVGILWLIMAAISVTVELGLRRFPMLTQPTRLHVKSKSQ